MKRYHSFSSIDLDFLDVQEEADRREIHVMDNASGDVLPENLEFGILHIHGDSNRAISYSVDMQNLAVKNYALLLGQEGKNMSKEHLTLPLRLASLRSTTLTTDMSGESLNDRTIPPSQRGVPCF